MKKREFITQLALNFFSDGLLLLHPKDIKKIEDQPDEIQKLANDCHIYLIVKRPRLSFVPNSITLDDSEIKGRLSYVKNGEKKEFAFSLPGRPDADSIEIDDYPHHKIFLIKNGVRVFTIPAHLIIMLGGSTEDTSIRDLNIVYVGMAYGDGTRSAKDRLSNHSTLQQVLADINHDFPDDEALIVMVQFEFPQTMITMDGRNKDLNIEDDIDVGAKLEEQRSKITEEIQIALIEAGLIRYFRPIYNEKYKLHFPSPRHKILESVYSINFGALSVEINTESIHARLYSDYIKTGYHHIACFDLFDTKIRESFFNIGNDDSDFIANDFSGPIF